MFYFDSDKDEIKGWIKQGDKDLINEIRQEIQRQLGNFVTPQQLSQYDAEFKSQIDIYVKNEFSSLQREINALKMSIVSASEFDNIKRELVTFKEEVSNLKQEISTPKTPPELVTLQNEVAKLRQELSTPKTLPELVTLQNEVATLKQELSTLKAPSTPPELVTLQNEVATLRQELSTLKTPSTPPPELVTLQNEVATLRQELSTLKTPSTPPELVTLQSEIATVKQELSTLQTPSTPPELVTLQDEVGKLKQELSTLQTPSTPPELVTLQSVVGKLKQELSTFKTPSTPPELVTLQNEIATLKQELSTPKTPPELVTLQDEVGKLKQEIDKLNQPTTPPIQPITPKTPITPPIQPTTPPTPPTTPPTPPIPPTPVEERFFLPEQQGTFLNNERTKITARLKQAQNVSGIEKYLSANPSEASKKFQKILANHSREMKRFVDKLKLTDINNEELSEVVTTKYFKLFHRTFFDNMVVAIRRGLKSSEGFYLGLLEKVNEYLSRCGIYTMNIKSGRKAENEDYENITPQTIKTEDKDLTGTIKEVERLPYRIKYLDEFGEEKYLQYAGVASIYKAV